MRKKIASVLFLKLILITSFAAANDCNDKYNSGEHKQLGDRGFLQACRASPFLNSCANFKIPRQDNNFFYSYGELVALADYFASVDKAYQNKINTDLLNGLFKCINKQGRALYEQQLHPEVPYPNCLWAMALSTPNYLILASTNYEHFAWDNVVTYVKYHDQALDLAIAAHNTQNYELFKKALFYNGYSDHFLTDAFAAGHIRIPRKQIRDWTKEHLFGPFKHIVSDAFAKILHDTDGKDRNKMEKGILVNNSRGDVWTTHSDGELNRCKNDEDDSIRLPAEAVESSVNEILAAYQTGQKPDGKFKALEFVPFASFTDIIEDFKLNGDKKHDKKIVKDLEHALPLPLRWIMLRTTLHYLLSELQNIIAQFKKDNLKDIETNQQLRERVPDNYLEAYTH